MPDAPSIEHIREFAEHVNKTWIDAEQGRLDQFFLSLYFQEFKVLLPDTKDERRHRQFDMERMKLAEGTRIVDIIGSRYATPPYLGLMPVESGSSAPAVRDDIEWGLNEIVNQLNPAAQGQGPYSVGVFQQNLLGRKAELILSGNEYYHDYPFRKEGESEESAAKRVVDWGKAGPIPVLWQDLPAEATFPASLGSIEDAVLSQQNMTWAELERVFSPEELSVVKRSDNATPFDSYVLAIHSDKIYITWAILQGGEERKLGPLPMGHRPIADVPLRQIEHKMGRCAIRIIPGMTTGKKEPGKYWKSSLYAVADMIIQAERVASMVLTSEKLRTLPTTLAYLRNAVGQGGELTDGALARMRQMMESDMWLLDAGDPQQGVPAEKMEPFAQPTATPEAMNFLGFVLGRISRTSHTPGVLEGDMGGANTPAWSVNFAAETAAGGLADLTLAVGAGHIDAAEGIMRAISAFGENVPLTQFKDENAKNIILKPEQLAQYLPVLKTEMRAKVPINKRADYALGLQFLEAAKNGAAIPSITWIAETFFGIERPHEMAKEKVTWDIMTSQTITDALAKDVLQEAQVEVAGDEEMGDEQAMQLLAQIPEPLRSALAQRMKLGGQGGGGAAGGGPGRSGDLQGAVRSATMTITKPGPSPAEEL